MQAKCPNCRWQPGEDAEWSCEACGYQWNMFDTAARCPRCSYQHDTTYCIEWLGGCGEVSPHIDWYEGIDSGLAEVNIKRLFN